MSKSLDRELKKYDYQLPKSAIALEPASPRDAAKLLVFDRRSKKAEFGTFKNLVKYLPKGAVLAFNQTKVLPARISAIKETGGRVKLLYLNRVGGGFSCLCEKKLAERDRIFLPGGKCLTVVKKIGATYILKPSFPISQFFQILKKSGETPIPLYLKHTPMSEARLRKAYQTVFAKNEGSVAAPTASLHFSKALLRKLQTHGFDRAFVTLHVGLGTFAPLSSEALLSGKLHEEVYSIDPAAAKFLNRAKKAGRPIIAVGTTAVRTLESAVDARGRLAKLSGKTKLFIREGYHFKFINGMITNFHVPRSSLLMLVSAFAGRRRILELYQKALKHGYRFFSFGDGTLIL